MSENSENARQRYQGRTLILAIAVGILMFGARQALAAEFEVVASSFTADGQVNASSAAYFQQMTVPPLAPNTAGVTSFQNNSNPGGLYWDGSHFKTWDYASSGWVALGTGAWSNLTGFPGQCAGGNVLAGFNANGTAICVSPGGANIWTTFTSGSNTGVTQVSPGPVVLTSTVTVQGNAFSVGGSSFIVSGSSVGINTGSSSAPNYLFQVGPGSNGSSDVIDANYSGVGLGGAPVSGNALTVASGNVGLGGSGNVTMNGTGNVVLTNSGNGGPNSTGVNIAPANGVSIMGLVVTKQGGNIILSDANNIPMVKIK